MNLGSLDLANANFAATQPKLPSAKGNFDKTARDFEAVFIGQMFEQMWSEVKTDGPMGGGTGEKIFRSLMIQDLGKQIADQGGMGLAAMVKRELLAIQEGKRQ